MIERGWMPSRWTLSETTSQSVLGAEMIAVSPPQIVLAAAANPVVDLGGWQIELGDYTIVDLIAASTHAESPRRANAPTQPSSRYRGRPDPGRRPTLTR